MNAIRPTTLGNRRSSALSTSLYQRNAVSKWNVTYETRTSRDCRVLPNILSWSSHWLPWRDVVVVAEVVVVAVVVVLVEQLK